MNYQIIHLGKRSSAERIARSITEILPAGSYKIVDLASQTPDLDVELNFFCFELSKGACPFAVLESIERMEGKKLVLVAISSISDDEAFRKLLESQLEPFLPESSENLGLYLCKGRFSEEDLDVIRRRSAQAGKSADEEKLHALFEESQNHPDMMDLYNVLQFVNQRLDI